MDRPITSAGHSSKDTLPQGPQHRVAGGRTSVSAPLGARPQVTDPMGRQRPWIGQQLAAGRTASTRAVCLVSHPDQPLGPFAFTPTLSHSHPGSASRASFGGRGGDARRCRWVSDRSRSPTDARSVGSGTAAGQAWEPRCGSPSERDRPISATSPTKDTRSQGPKHRVAGPCVALCGGERNGVFDPEGLVAQRDVSCSIQVQRSGHGGPPPHHPWVGPTRWVVLGDADLSFRSKVSGQPTFGFRSIQVQWSGHGGPRSRHSSSDPFRRAA